MLFAISGLICWCGISQVISNSVVSSFKNAFSIPPIYTTVVLVAVAAVIVLRKNATVKVLDMIVPIMAVVYFAITILIIVMNLGSLPGVFARIFEEAFGFRQAAAGGFGAVLMNGIKRGLFSNEAGSGSAPCAAAAAECDQPVKAGLVQALGVFVDTIVICSCTAMIMLLAPEEKVAGLSGMDLLQTAMEHHLGKFGVIFIAVTLFLFSFSTFLGILFYARSNVAYLFGDSWAWQTAYKVLALVMLFIGGLAAYTFVWDLGDVGIGLMTIFNIIILYPQGEKALRELKEYEKANARTGKQQYAVPYFMSSHPGCTMKEAVKLAEYVRDLGFTPEQVQDFYPTPSTLSTCMYYTEIHPLTGEKVYVPKNPHEKAIQRALMQYKNPENRELILEGLKMTGRMDLEGFGPKCLIRPRELHGKNTSGRNADSNQSGRKAA